MREDLINILEKYIPQGFLHGVEFLLPPEAALLFINDLVARNVIINGCDLWKFIDRKKPQIVALLGAGISTDLQETVQQRGEAVKHFIQHQLPEDAQLVSLIYAEDDMYNLVREYRNR